MSDDTYDWSKTKSFALAVHAGPSLSTVRIRFTTVDQQTPFIPTSMERRPSAHGELAQGVTLEHMGVPTCEERVRALEDELGISTSDAQAMIDAEDVLAAQNR